MRGEIALPVRPVPFRLAPRPVGRQALRTGDNVERHSRIVTAPEVHRDTVLVVAREDEVAAAAVVEILAHGVVGEGGLAARVLVRVRVAVILTVIIADQLSGIG